MNGAAAGPSPQVAPSVVGASPAGPAPRREVATRADRALGAEPLRSQVVSWYLPLLAGLLPVLLGGFLASALANRIAFAGWALAAGAAYTVWLRSGVARGWDRRARAAGALALLAAAAATFAALVERHQEIFDLGYRAVLPGLYRSTATRPASYLALAAALAVAAVWQASAWRAVVRRREAAA
jgi:hypothetical protein